MRDRLAQTLLHEKKFIFIDIPFFFIIKVIVDMVFLSIFILFVTKVFFVLKLAPSPPISPVRTPPDNRQFAKHSGKLSSGFKVGKQSMVGNPDHSRIVVFFHSCLHCLPLSSLSLYVLDTSPPSHAEKADCRSPLEIQTHKKK